MKTGAILHVLRLRARVKWVRGPATLRESMSVEAWPYEDIPSFARPAVTAFRHLNSADRLRICKRAWNEARGAR